MRDEGNYRERIILHSARLLSSSLPAGQDYKEIPYVIVISIVDFVMFECEEAHSEFRLLEVNRREELSDKQAFHFYELKKLKTADSLEVGDERNLWLSLFNAETWEELDKILLIGGEVMSQAVETYRGIVATDEFKNLEMLRWKTGLYEGQALYYAEKRGEKRAKKRMEQMIVTAIQNHVPHEAVKAMCVSAGIAETRLDELRKLAQKL